MSTLRPRLRPHPARLVLAAVFPGRCPGCDGVGEAVCARCRSGLSPPPAGAPPVGVDRWAAAFSYDGVARELIARAKYQGCAASWPWLARCMVDAWCATGPEPVDLVTWAPTAAVRRRARGIDHARVLAREVSRRLECPTARLLTRRAGPAQTDRPITERRGGPVVLPRGTVAGTVLLVDDVATTGATLRVCAAALRSAGAVSVVALTAARTPPHRARS